MPEGKPEGRTGGREGVEAVVHWGEGDKGEDRESWDGGSEGRKEGNGKGYAVYEGRCDGYNVGYCAEDDCGNGILYVEGDAVGIKVYEDWYRGYESRHYCGYRCRSQNIRRRC